FILRAAEECGHIGKMSVQTRCGAGLGIRIIPRKDLGARETARILCAVAKERMKVLVTFAVDAEFAPWRKLRDLRETKMDDVVLHQVQVGRAQGDFVVSGMGG